MSPDFLAMTLIFRKIEEVRIRLHADLKDLLCVNQLPNLRSGKAKSLICLDNWPKAGLEPCTHVVAPFWPYCVTRHWYRSRGNGMPQ